MPSPQERILGWPAYPVPRLDQNVLSRLTEYDDIIIGPPFSALPRPPNLKSITAYDHIFIFL